MTTNKYKRRKFFIKGNFQLTFIACLILFLLAEIIFGSLIIYQLAYKAIEEAAFRSHITINTSAQIITPIVIRINSYVSIASVLISCFIATIAYVKRRALFAKILEGLENIKNNNTSFRIHPYGGRNTRSLIEEFNHSMSHFGHRRKNINNILDSLIEEKDPAKLVKLHNDLFCAITKA